MIPDLQLAAVMPWLSICLHGICEFGRFLRNHSKTLVDMSNMKPCARNIHLFPAVQDGTFSKTIFTGLPRTCQLFIALQTMSKASKTFGQLIQQSSHLVGPSAYGSHLHYILAAVLQSGYANMVDVLITDYHYNNLLCGYSKKMCRHYFCRKCDRHWHANICI